MGAGGLMSAVFPLCLNASFAGWGGPLFGAPRREFAPAWRVTFFAGAKKVTKETPNTSLFERSWLCHWNPLQQVVRFVATSIHVHVKGLFFQPRLAVAFSTVIPAFAGMTKNIARLWNEVLLRRSKPKTSPERQWPLAEPRLQVCAPAPSHLSPNRLVFRCFLGDFFCTSV